MAVFGILCANRIQQEYCIVQLPFFGIKRSTFAITFRAEVTPRLELMRMPKESRAELGTRLRQAPNYSSSLRNNVS